MTETTEMNTFIQISERIRSLIYELNVHPVYKEAEKDCNADRNNSSNPNIKSIIDEHGMKAVNTFIKTSYIYDANGLKDNLKDLKTFPVRNYETVFEELETEVAKLHSLPMYDGFKITKNQQVEDLLAICLPEVYRIATVSIYAKCLLDEAVKDLTQIITEMQPVVTETKHDDPIPEQYRDTQPTLETTQLIKKLNLRVGSLDDMPYLYNPPRDDPIPEQYRDSSTKKATYQIDFGMGPHTESKKYTPEEKEKIDKEIEDADAKLTKALEETYPVESNPFEETDPCPSNCTCGVDCTCEPACTCVIKCTEWETKWLKDATITIYPEPSGNEVLNVSRLKEVTGVETISARDMQENMKLAQPTEPTVIKLEPCSKTPAECDCNICDFCSDAECDCNEFPCDRNEANVEPLNTIHSVIQTFPYPTINECNKQLVPDDCVFSYFSSDEMYHQFLHAIDVEPNGWIDVWHTFNAEQRSFGLKLIRQIIDEDVHNRNIVLETLHSICAEMPNENQGKAFTRRRKAKVESYLGALAVYEKRINVFRRAMRKAIETL